MSLWLRVPLALVAGATGAFVAFLVLFVAAGLLSPACPPAVDVCDLPGIAAFGLALMGAPLVGLVVSGVAFRRIGEWDV